MKSFLFGAALVYMGGAPHGAAALAFIIRRTTYGRWIYAVGANPQAATLMGVPTKAIAAIVSAIDGMPPLTTVFQTYCRGRQRPVSA